MSQPDGGPAFSYATTILYELGIVKDKEGYCSFPETYQIQYAKALGAVQKWIDRAIEDAQLQQREERA